jgi:hypothetical protein
VVSFSEGAPKQLRGNASPQNRITEHKEYYKQDTNYFLSPKTGHYIFETGHYIFETGHYIFETGHYIFETGHYFFETGHYFFETGHYFSETGH